MKTKAATAKAACPQRMAGHLRAACAQSLLLLLLSIPTLAPAENSTAATNRSATNGNTFSGGNPAAIRAAVIESDGTLTNVDGTGVGTASRSLPQSSLAVTNGPTGRQLGDRISGLAVAQFQGEAGHEIGFQPSAQIRTEAGDKPEVLYSTGLELQVVTPINVVPSKKYPGLEYSGIFVQAARSNPLQLFNPFAPAKYGNGEANVVRHFVTGEVEGLKLWRISY